MGSDLRKRDDERPRPGAGSGRFRLGLPSLHSHLHSTGPCRSTVSIDLSPGEPAVEDGGDLPVLGRQEVGVDLGGGGDLGVPEDLHDHPQ